MTMSIPYTKPDGKKPTCNFCNIKMTPQFLIEKNYLFQKWKFKCSNCEIEFSEWV